MFAKSLGEGSTKELDVSLKDFSMKSSVEISML